jgi:hypothetical protein
MPAIHTICPVSIGKLSFNSSRNILGWLYQRTTILNKDTIYTICIYKGIGYR